MNTPMITIYAATFLAFMHVFLTLRVGFTRRGTGILIGDGNNEEMLYSIRRHGNFTENTPLFLVLLALLELTAGAILPVKIFAGLYVLARISHVIGLRIDSPLPPRAFGAIGTMASLVGTAVTLLVMNL